MKRPAAWFALTYLAGMLTATCAIVNHGTELARPLFAIASWLANASAGSTYEVAVEPVLTIDVAPSVRTKGSKR